MRRREAEEAVRMAKFMEGRAPPSGVVGSPAVQEEEWEWIFRSLASIWEERLQCRRPRRVRRSRLTAAGKGPNADRIGCETSALRGRDGSVLRGPSYRSRLRRSTPPPRSS